MRQGPTIPQRAGHQRAGHWAAPISDSDDPAVTPEPSAPASPDGAGLQAGSGPESGTVRVSRLGPVNLMARPGSPAAQSRSRRHHHRQSAGRPAREAWRPSHRQLGMRVRGDPAREQGNAAPARPMRVDESLFPPRRARGSFGSRVARTRPKRSTGSGAWRERPPVAALAVGARGRPAEAL